MTYLPVPSDARIPTLPERRADLIAAALTRTPERAEQVDFSLTYFQDGQRLLVPGLRGCRRLRSSGQEGRGHRRRQRVETISGAAADCGFELGDNLVIFRRHTDAVQALLDGEVDAFTSDGMALRNFAEGQPLKVVGDPFSKEPYGFAATRAISVCGS